MKLAVIGTGYVGIVTGACFAEMGNSVICVDTDESKIENLKKGIIPIYEPGLDRIVLDNVKNRTLQFTTDVGQALNVSTIFFIAVGTPMGEDGSADLQYVLNVAKSIGKLMMHHVYVVNKSTVPVGTAKLVRQAILKELEKRKSNLTFDVISNPEFLKEGSAVNDFMKPDRIIIGTDNEEAASVMRELYRPFTMKSERFLEMDISSAEMTKYAANAMLATKISFMNEIANICERVGADVNMVRIGIGSDTRIGYHFIYPGVGFGGSCFPKDVQSLIKTSMEYGYTPELIKAVQNVNKLQKRVIIQKIISRFGQDLSGKIFAVWGLSFKPGTNDMREAPSISIIQELTQLGALIQAYDPKAMEEAKNFYLKDNRHVNYFNSKYDVLNGADALILITEWKEFRSPDFDEIVKRMKSPIVFDGRNQYDSDIMLKHGFEYWQIGRERVLPS